ncbi:MAG: hypothetical protein ABIT96_10390 [Ferruginibacter sp.]
MIQSIRQKFNGEFTPEKYAAYMQEIESLEPGTLDFRNAETPLFIPADFKNKMLGACDDIIDFIKRPDFKTLTARSIPADMVVPGEDDHPQFIVFDFGVCENNSGGLEPQLIEMQGFPSLFAFQAYHSAITARYADVPDNMDAYLSGYNTVTYTRLLREIIVGDENPENVILLEIYPESQKTRIDFFCTEKLLNIKTVCLTKLKADGRSLYYLDGDRRVSVKRIYNRVIFDDVKQQDLPVGMIDLTQSYDVKWVPHPNWFYRISKFTLPFIQNEYIPETFFLHEIKEPLPLEDFVLKPLFSFAGMGVVIDVKQEDLDAIKNPENWILQRKVTYAPVIVTPDEPAKAEIRLFYFWKESWDRPVAVHNLSRLSKGKMIGTRYNKDKEWVGGSVSYFEKD